MTGHPALGRIEKRCLARGVELTGNKLAGRSMVEWTGSPMERWTANQMAHDRENSDALVDTEGGPHTPVVVWTSFASLTDWDAKTVEPGNKCHDSGPDGVRHDSVDGFVDERLDGPN